MADAQESLIDIFLDGQIDARRRTGRYLRKLRDRWLLRDPAAQMLLEHRLHLASGKISLDGDDCIRREEVALVKRHQIRTLDRIKVHVFNLLAVRRLLAVQNFSELAARNSGGVVIPA